MKLEKFLKVERIVTFVVFAGVCAAFFVLWHNRVDLSDTKIFNAEYVGVQGGVWALREDVLSSDTPAFFFKAQDRKVLLAAGSLPEKTGKDSVKDEYPVQNLLIHGCTYRITSEDGKITNAEPVPSDPLKYRTVSKPVPGKRTVKNFLATALYPLGTVTYVKGGGWNFQNDGAGVQARTIGISDSWVRFTYEHGATYDFHNDSWIGRNYYPERGWNEFYHAGLDSEGFAGWTLYNTFYSKSLAYPGLVFTAAEFLKKMSDVTGAVPDRYVPEGPADEAYYRKVISRIKPGDMVCIPGHIYTAAGVCRDGSLLVIHSAQTSSCEGGNGGGVQISAVSPKGINDRSCDAFVLAGKYMTKYFRYWSEKYPPVLMDPAQYLVFADENSGILHWPANAKGLYDPEGFSQKSGEKVLAEILGPVQ